MADLRAFAPIQRTHAWLTEPSLGAMQFRDDEFQRPWRYALVALYYVFVLGGAAGDWRPGLVAVVIVAPLFLLVFDVFRYWRIHDRDASLRTWSYELPADVLLTLLFSATLEPLYYVAPLVAVTSIYTASTLFERRYVVTLAVLSGLGVVPARIIAPGDPDVPLMLLIAATLPALGAYFALRASTESRLRSRLAGQTRFLAFNPNPPAGLLIFDANGALSFSNNHSTARAIAGEIDMGVLRSDLAAGIQSAIAGGSLALDLPLGGAEPVIARVVLFPNSGGAGAITLDITSEVQADRALVDATGHLAAGVAHDFNNVLVVIQGHADMAAERLESDSDAQVDLAAIRDAVHRATGLIDDLLAVGRRRMLAKHRVAVGTALLDMEPALARAAGDDVSVDLVIACKSSVELDLDERELERSLVALVGYARASLPAGGRVRIKCADAPQVGAANGNHSGIAISVAFVQNTEDASLRDRVTQRGQSVSALGFGLGIPAIRGSIEQNGGQLRLEDLAERGSVATVLFPSLADQKTRE